MYFSAQYLIVFFANPALGVIFTHNTIIAQYIDDNSKPCYAQNLLLADRPNTIEDFNQAIKCNPNYAEAYIYRAATYFNLGDKERAKEDLQKAAKFYQEQGNEQRQKEILQMIDKINSR